MWALRQQKKAGHRDAERLGETVVGSTLGRERYRATWSWSSVSSGFGRMRDVLALQPVAQLDRRTGRERKGVHRLPQAELDFFGHVAVDDIEVALGAVRLNADVEDHEGAGEQILFFQ